MKRVVKASSTAEAVHSAVEFLGSEGVDEHDVLMHFFDYLPAAESLKILEDYIKMCDLDDEWKAYK